MSSILQQTRLALWVWIVIIVVGSVIILGTIALILRLAILRRRKAAFVDTFGDEDLPQRRVTVRRGRIVEQSKYLSLTGSKFGLNAFVGEEVDSRAGARSKSPFEWWSTLKDRSNSRNSQVTQMTLTGDGSSIHGLPTSPNHQRLYGRRDFNYSSTSIASIPKEDEVSVTVTDPEPSPPLVRNFSRSFSRQGQHSNFAARQQTLSRIEESSPHTSMISSRQSRVASYASTRRDTKTSTPSPLPHSPAILEFPKPAYATQNQPSRSKTSSLCHETLPEQPQQDTDSPLRFAYNGSRSDLRDTAVRLSHASSRNSFAASTKSARRHSQQVTALPEPPASPEETEYWEARSDSPTGRSATLKKGNVLRKKSLKKAELVSQIDS